MSANGARSQMKAAGDERAKRCVEMVLAYDPLTAALEIGGEVVNIDMARSILAQADRAFDKLQRQQNALELQAHIREANENAAIAARIRGGN